MSWSLESQFPYTASSLPSGLLQARRSFDVLTRTYQRLISELSHTVDFDLDQIESSTVRLCQHTLMHDEFVEETGGVFWRDVLSPSSGPLGNSFGLTGGSDSLPPPHLWREDSAPHLNNSTDVQTSGTFQCDADEMLAQAQGVPLGHRIDEFINFNDFPS